MLFKRQTIFIWLLGIAVGMDCRVSAETRPALPCSPPALQLNLTHNDYAAAHLTLPVLYSETSEDGGRQKPGIITGSIMIFGGGLLYLAGHIMAYRTYDDYKKSAFTEQTDRLRRKVNIFNGMRIGGGVIGGAGLLVLVFSF
jgi:hypothetical protein